MIYFPGSTLNIGSESDATDKEGGNAQNAHSTTLGTFIVRCHILRPATRANEWL